MDFQLKMVWKEAVLARFEVLSKKLLILTEESPNKPAAGRVGLQGWHLKLENPRILKINANDLVREDR